MVVAEAKAFQWSTSFTMAEYDLTKTIVPFIDKHLAFPLLTHLLELGLFPEEDVRLAQYELAKATNMVDFTLELFEQIYPNQEAPAGEYSRRIVSR